MWKFECDTQLWIKSSLGEDQCYNLLEFHLTQARVLISPQVPEIAIEIVRFDLPIMLYKLCGANCLGIFWIASLYTLRAS